MAFPCNIIRWFYVVYILVREDHRIRLGQGRYSLCSWICSQYFHILLEIYQPIRGQEIMELDKKIVQIIHDYTYFPKKIMVWFFGLNGTAISYFYRFFAMFLFRKCCPFYWIYSYFPSFYNKSHFWKQKRLWCFQVVEHSKHRLIHCKLVEGG